ncbi:MAG TPA: fused isobutyryl-CoA mutase/GTPase IcmF [Chthonomonadaceae bacterium]|nr:fused isobutyryl-CoA mutase/GTPase IcmF [Chthonomonadaceae bacterium]
METTIYHPKNKIRFVTAASLYDGHDASINIMRRILQASGVEVIHLGHNRSAEEIVTTAIQEDAQGIAVSSYQGGHVEFFKYMRDLLEERGAGHIKLFGGGGGVIIPEEAADLEAYGITKIYSPEDGRRLGLQGIINDMLRHTDFPTVTNVQEELPRLSQRNPLAIARLITYAEQAVTRKDKAHAKVLAEIRAEAPKKPVVGITGTGGAGKSSLTDELVRRFLADFPEKTLASLSVDPSRQKTGGALLGDRIRMNAIQNPRVYMRSLATRGSGSELSAALTDAIAIVKTACFDLILIETSGIGQGDAAIVDLCDVSLYVMTGEFGAPSQLEKIDMLDYADLVAINKFDRRGSEDALRDVKKQVQRNQKRFDRSPDEMPVYGTIASQFHDRGVNTLYHALIAKINEKTGADWKPSLTLPEGPPKKSAIIPPDRTPYLGEIVRAARDYRRFVEEQAALARKLYQLHGLRDTFAGQESVLKAIEAEIAALQPQLHPECRQMLEAWSQIKEEYTQDELVTKVRDKEIRTQLYTTSLSGTRIPKIALPRYTDWGDILRWLLTENVPGAFPYTAGVFSFKREDELPKRQFAGQGTPERTNRRFHYLSEGEPATRLSTAFDSVTLYGEDPDYRPDIYGKIGESGVSICTLDDMKQLYAGFDLCAPSTSVSMTINGPAPIILAMFFNTAIDQQVEKFAATHGRQPDAKELARIQAQTLSTVRGTVQADILKEDQGQNTCIFSTEFALRMMGDVQQYFIDRKVRNYYSVSISGYHIAEAGANPISQLAFTLSNAFTYVEYYLSRGMKIDDFAPNFSFFFSNGMDPEYTVIGRVARRIWATVIKNKYGGNDRSQKLKYHVQTSGRSLHAQEIGFNDIRTTLQALLALQDNCNSLHTNAYDEAITTPTEESLRRAMAIQLILTKEFGLLKNENPIQGAFIVEELTDLVEEAVLQEFERINDRGGVLGAMETQYQRSRIQEESLIYEGRKHDGSLPIVGVNTFRDSATLEQQAQQTEIPLERASQEEKELQIANLRAFQQRHAEQAPQKLEALKQAATEGGNIFAELMNTVRYCSLGQITRALYEVGGQYRRNM